MKKLFLLVVLIFIFSVFGSAQNISKKQMQLTPVMMTSFKTISASTDASDAIKIPIKRCGTSDADAYRMAHDSVYRAEREQTEKSVEQWIADHPNYDPKTTYTIPVVVHIIYNTNTPAECLAPSRVADQIAATNSDWAGTNPHTMNSFSSSLKVTTGVQFCLATKDASGNSTTGITYTQTTVTSFSTSGTASSCNAFPERCSSKGGCDAWDQTKYLNIWVCNMAPLNGNQLCGISEFPKATNDVYYGSTIQYQFFGTTGSMSPYNLGGTLSHELGHCFNLYHIWGDRNGQACSATTYPGSDLCGDTPSQYTETSGYHAGVLTDQCTTASPGILYEDFMDYSDDLNYACFTPNQVSRIQAIAAGDDLSLNTSYTAGRCTITAPVVDFTPSATTIIAGATVTFTDISTNNPTTWSWVLAPTTGFSYVNSTTSTSQNPQIMFTIAGSYTVTLTAGNSAGSSNKSRTITVNAPTAKPVAAFNYSPSSVTIGATVSFTDASTSNPATWSWSLNPTTGFSYVSGTNSSTQNPKIIFTTAGIYTVKLKVTNSIGSDSTSKTVTVADASCITLYPPTNSLVCGDTMAYYHYTSPYGYLTGTDYFNDAEMAQKFYNTTSGNIDTVKVAVKALKNPTDCNTYVKIYSVNATTKAPSTLLGTSNAVLYSTISTTGGFVNYIFPTPVAITGDFCASFVLPTGKNDTAIVYATKITCHSADSLSWEYDGSAWSAFKTTFVTYGYNFDLFIHPVICTTITVGVNDMINEKEVNIYPNPTKNEFTVDFSNYKHTNATIEVYDMIGKLVKSISSNGLTDKMVIDISNENSGIYFVNIKTPEGTVVKKLSLIR